MKKSTINDGKLHEFIKIWNNTEWKKVQKIATSKYLHNFRKSSEKCLDLLISERTKLKKEKELSFDVFKQITYYSGALNDWRYFTSEVLKLCYMHLSFSLTDEETQMANQWGTQRYFAEKAMWTNYDELLEKNRDAAFSPKNINDSMQGVWMSKLRETELSDIRNKEDRTKEEPFDNWNLANELHYYENKLRILCAYLGVSSFKKLHQKIEAKDNPISKIPNSIKHFPQIVLYILAYQLRKEEQDITFHELWELLDKELADKRLSNKYLEPLYIILMSHCVVRSKCDTKGDEFRRYFIKIADQLIAKKLLIEQGTLHSTHFRNIIISHLKLGQNAEAIKFSQKYPKLLINENHPIVKYCKALNHYYKNEYAKTYKILNELPKECEMNNYLKVDTKLLLLLVCLELNKHEQFLREERNINLMMKRRKKVSNEYLETWQNTAHYLQEIYNVPSYEIKTQFPLLTEKIKEEQHIRHKQWLLEYIDRQIKKR